MYRKQQCSPPCGVCVVVTPVTGTFARDIRPPCAVLFFLDVFIEGELPEKPSACHHLTVVADETYLVAIITRCQVSNETELFVAALTHKAETSSALVNSLHAPAVLRCIDDNAITCRVSIYALITTG